MGKRSKKYTEAIELFNKIMESEEIDLPSLVYAGRNFCSNNPCLIKVSVQNLRNLGEYSFSKLDKVQELSFSSLQS